MAYKPQVLNPLDGGTGVSNTSTSTLTLGGSVQFSGAYNSVFTLSNTTAVTFPTAGTLATTSQLPSITATQYDVLVGGAANAVVSVGPGTAGQILQSGGNASNPAYSTSTYPATNAANTLLYASSANVMAALATANNGVLITSASGVPSLLADGTTGQVLTATTGSPPSWATPASQFLPNQNIQVFDDFLGWDEGTLGATATYILSQLTWLTPSTAPWYGLTAVAGHPGVCVSGSISVSNPATFLMWGNAGNLTQGCIILGYGALTLNWVFQIVTASTGTNTYTLVAGIGKTVTAAAQTDGCWFSYNSGVNSGNWVINTAASSTATNTNTAVAVTTGWHNAQIVINAGGTSVQFFMDGVSLGTISTHMPTTDLYPLLLQYWTAGTNNGAINCDLFYMNYALTTAR